MKSCFDQQEKKLNELMEMTRGTNRRISSLEQDPRQPRLAMEADVQADTKTRERTEGVAKAGQAMHGDSFSANRVNLDPMCSTSFGDDCTGPAALPCSREDALVDRRCGAQIVSLTLRDTLTNSRRWLTTHQRNLYGNEDHLRPPNSLMLPN